ncbi:MAG: L7Ae/L30e/S12e/Gadd45 family ribosomal protein [Firmicutes bacterium]|nr:L7Ae/L30e/S12e/Gadd45 family ribosomal protein [Bacillota bacterium]MCL5040154.1 L7Ae/L30e/S12e/Gadd45 family ribosomal protein [Bacillota bacterium]
MEDKVRNLLGLAKKAGRLVLGTERVKRALEDKTVKLLIIANDAGVHSRWEAGVLADRNSIPYVYLSNKVELGLIFGQATIALAGITDDNMVREIQRILAEGAKPMGSS